MLRFLFKLTAFTLKAAVMIFLVFLAGTSNAGDGSLKRLDTGDDSRGWEAVGRLNIGGFGIDTPAKGRVGCRFLKLGQQGAQTLPIAGSCPEQISAQRNKQGSRHRQSKS